MAARNQVERSSRSSRSRWRSARRTSRSHTTDGHPRTRRSTRRGRRCAAIAAFRPATVVRATSLDAWLSARPDLAPRVRCIKIDVQGAESRVVAGMARTLLPTGVTIVCETSIGTDADVMLERAGFRRHRIERGTSPHGNFLYVRRRR